MDPLATVLLSFLIWFFAWHSLQTYIKSKKMNNIYYYMSGLIISAVIYNYFSNLDNEDNE